MAFRILLTGCVLAMAGCATTDSKPAPPSAEAAAPVSSTDAPLAGIVPANDFEADLIAHPDDVRGLASHALLLSNQAAVAETPDEERGLRRKARAFAAAALKGGSQNLLMPLLLEQTHEDGTPVEVLHSKDQAADTLIAEGEKKFARGDMDAALAAYLQAWEIDPTSHHTALFIGDVHFVNKEFDRAIEWFDRAIALSPFSETAHRYRGDALMRQRRTEEAGESYISAVIADPYHRIARSMLPHWASQTRRRFSAPKSSFPRGQLLLKNGRIELSHHPDDGTLSLGYLVARAAYVEEHQKNFAVHRHQLEEESHGLRKMLQIAEELRTAPDLVEEVKKHAASLQFFQRLVDTGLMEAHILLDRADEGLAQDYAAYRAAHPELLRRYIREVWLAPE